MPTDPMGQYVRLIIPFLDWCHGAGNVTVLLYGVALGNDALRRKDGYHDS